MLLWRQGFWLMRSYAREIFSSFVGRGADARKYGYYKKNSAEN